MKCHFLAEHINFLPWNAHGLAEYKVGGKMVTLIKISDHEMKACAHKCPHAGAVMAGGYTTAEQEIVCPLHRFRFSLANGQASNGHGFHLQVYKVWQEARGWFIEMPGGLFGW